MFIVALCVWCGFIIVGIVEAGYLLITIDGKNCFCTCLIGIGTFDDLYQRFECDRVGLASFLVRMLIARATVWYFLTATFV